MVNNLSNTRQVTKSLLQIADANKNLVTNLKAQKLLYFAHGLCLAKYDVPLVEGESFQAWRYGPVIESLYHHLKVFGDAPISPISPFLSSWESLSDSDDDEKRKRCLSSILRQFGGMAAGRLIDLSHDKNGPWSIAYQDDAHGIEVPNDKIKEYFAKRLVPVRG